MEGESMGRCAFVLFVTRTSASKTNEFQQLKNFIAPPSCFTDLIFTATSSRYPHFDEKSLTLPHGKVTFNIAHVAI